MGREKCPCSGLETGKSKFPQSFVINNPDIIIFYISGIIKYNFGPSPLLGVRLASLFLARLRDVVLAPTLASGPGSSPGPGPGPDSDWINISPYFPLTNCPTFICFLLPLAIVPSRLASSFNLNWNCAPRPVYLYVHENITKLAGLCKYYVIFLFFSPLLRVLLSAPAAFFAFVISQDVEQFKNNCF